MKERKVNPSWVDRDYGYKRPERSHVSYSWGYPHEYEAHDYALDALASLCERYRRCPYGLDWEECGGVMSGGCAACIEQMAYDGEPFPLDLFDRRRK